uniref:Ig-like domain-containing protein n=1 Tax=Callorhinchus milii TaxID=7868 RepID=A0A4W3JBI8_CALMI
MGRFTSLIQGSTELRIMFLLYSLFVTIVLSFTKPAGRTIRMKCDIKSSETVHWYQSKPNKPITRILYRANSKAQLDEETPGRFSTEAPSSNQQVLVINNVLEVDSATYYCAYWDSTKIFGTGTKLLVTDAGNLKQKQKSLGTLSRSGSIYGEREVNQPFVRLSMREYLRRKERGRGHSNPVEKENGETSYVISRFNVTQLQWKNSKVICGVQHESSKDNIEVHANGKKTSPKGTVRVSIAFVTCIAFCQGKPAMYFDIRTIDRCVQVDMFHLTHRASLQIAII